MKKYWAVFWTIFWSILFPILVGFSIGPVAKTLGKWLAGLGIGKADENWIPLTISLFLFYVGTLLLLSRRRNKKAKRILHTSVQALVTQQASVFKDEELPDRLEVNAALDQILVSRGEDVEAMKTVLKFASRMAPQTDWYEDAKRKPSGPGFTGLTWELGEVEIKDERGAGEKSGNLEKTRVGQYKVWRNLWLFFFQYYWGSDLATAANPLDAYAGHAIFFHPETFEPLGFGNIECVEFKGAIPFTKDALLAVNLTAGQAKGAKIPIGIISLR